MLTLITYDVYFLRDSTVLENSISHSLIQILMVKKWEVLTPKGTVGTCPGQILQMLSSLMQRVHASGLISQRWTVRRRTLLGLKILALLGPRASSPLFSGPFPSYEAGTRDTGMQSEGSRHAVAPRAAPKLGRPEAPKGCWLETPKGRRSKEAELYACDAEGQEA